MIAKGGVRSSERTGVGTGATRGIAALVGAVAIAGAGTLAWNGGALGGLRGVGYDAPLGMALLGFLIGAGAFFAPCVFVTFPAYVSYYVSLGGGGLRYAVPLG